MSTMEDKKNEQKIGKQVDSVSLMKLLMENDVNINGKVISRKEKEYINKIVEQIYEMDWKLEDARIKMMFDLSLVIDEIKKIQTP